MKELRLFPYQEDHVARLKSIFHWSPFALDLSMLGTGKTYVSCWLSRDTAMGFKWIMVIAPVSVTIKWKEMEREYGVPLVGAYSYNAIRGTTRSQPKHGYLNRMDSEDKDTPPSFSVTPAYLDLVRDGLLLVIDEIQHVKNSTSSQFVACKTLVNAIVDAAASPNNKSKVLLLSGSPVDKKEHVTHLFKTLGIMKQKDLAYFNVAMRQLVNKGIDDVLLYCNNLSRAESHSVTDIPAHVASTENEEEQCEMDKREISPQTCFLCLKETESIIETQCCSHPLHRECLERWQNIGNCHCPICGHVLMLNCRRDLGQSRWRSHEEYKSVDDIRNHCYDLFQRVVKPTVASSMISAVTTDANGKVVTLQKSNAHYAIMEPYDRTLLSQGIETLRSVSGYNAQTQKVDFRNGGSKTIAVLSAINAALHQIERAKIRTFARIAKDALNGNENCKVVICVNFSQTIHDLRGLLQKYDPLVLNGSTSAKQRRTVITQFQESNRCHRLLLGNVQVCATGIDLDDKHGEFPRMVFVSPNYRTIDLYQLGHRFLRMDTKSDATIHFVFGKHDQETGVLRSLARKSKVMKETVSEQVQAGVVFPGDYDTFIEPGGDTPATLPPPPHNNNNINGNTKSGASTKMKQTKLRFFSPFPSSSSSSSTHSSSSSYYSASFASWQRQPQLPQQLL